MMIERLPDQAELTDVKSEQTRILFTAIPSSLFTILVASTILMFSQWQVIDQHSIIAWFVVTNLLSLVRLFSDEMQNAANQQCTIEKGLRQALTNNEFELYFQGQYDNVRPWSI